LGVSGVSVDIRRGLRFWLTGLVVFFIVLYLLRSILLPFVAGMAVAYLFDPLCDRLERRGLSRTWATTLVTAVFLLAGLAVLILLVPVAVGQLSDFVKRVPGYLGTLQTQLLQLSDIVQAQVSPETLQRVRDLAGGSLDKIFGWLTGLVTGLLSGGIALANLLSLLVITPIVAFYLLRDWDRILEQLDSWLPREHADTIRDLARQIDERMAGFVRGQGTVCLVLGAFYAVGLSIVGLDFALVIGLISGLLSFVPFVGSLVGFAASVGLALAQFDSWLRIALVAAVFLLGQAAEGNFLTPKLVGERVGLHPVWVMFAMLAAGALFGFVGVLLAVPMAAVAGVMLRFAMQQYLDSDYYRGSGKASGEDGGS
jgi:predicted PurR-regulated permease PerM